MRRANIKASFVMTMMTLCVVTGLPINAASGQTRGTSEGWQTAEPNKSSNGRASDSQTAVNAAGDAVAVWSQSDDGLHSRIYAKRYTVADGWGEAVLVDWSTDGSYNPHIAIDPAGNAIAVWHQRNEIQNTGNVWANRYVVGTGWSGAVELGAVPNGGSYELDVAVNASGSAVAAWLWTDGSKWEIRANRFNPLSGWSGAVPVNTGGYVVKAALVGAAGNAMVARDRSDATDYDSLDNDSARNARPEVWQQIFTTLFDLMANLYVPGVGRGTPVPPGAENLGHAIDPQIAIGGDDAAVARKTPQPIDIALKP